MEKKRGIRFSIKMKILIGSILINIVVCAVMAIAVYRSVYASYVQTASEHTLAMCQIAARQLNGNLLGLLEQGSDAEIPMYTEMAIKLTSPLKMVLSN